eukprot:4638634-Amphidinium_carterae.1
MNDTIKSISRPARCVSQRVCAALLLRGPPLQHSRKALYGVGIIQIQGKIMRAICWKMALLSVLPTRMG